MKFRLLLAIFVFGICVSSYGQPDTVRSGRFTRGTGTNAAYHSFVVPLDLQKGLVSSNIGGLAGDLCPWNTTTLYHYDATNPASSSNLSLRIPFANPIACFGSRVGGSPLYYGQQYRFGLYSGHIPPNQSVGVILWTFAISPTNVTTLSGTYIPLPNPGNTNEWSTYLTNGYARTFVTNGLTTIVNFDQTFQMWGANLVGQVTLTHVASPAASNYVFQVELVGYTAQGFVVYDGFGQPTYNRMYTVEFEQRPPWQAVFIDQPHFEGEPLPPSYQGKSTEELLTNSLPVATTFSLSGAPATYTNLDVSPELRRHPILDQFVADMRRDPIALARYVQNEIDLTDAVSYNDNGSISEVSINPPGVARGALATYQEGQGGPAEQCALLIYLLRQAGVPAVYVYPPHNGLKMLDMRLSRLLRMQFRGAVNNLGQTYTTNRLIPVNYPWVAAYVGTNWVHLFPWIKDTSIEEGLNLYDYTGTNYVNGFQWLKDYLYGSTNIFSLASEDDTAGVLFPKFVQRQLELNAPGVSLDDIGVRFINRRHSYARWQDFPVPFTTPTNGIALDTLSSPTITNVFPSLTNIFDLFQVEVRSVANTNKAVSSGLVRMVDVHNRRLLIRHEKTGANAHNLILSLAAFRPGATGPSNFVAGGTLVNTQRVSVALNSTDDDLKVTLTHFRHRSLPVGGDPLVQQYNSYPWLLAYTTLTRDAKMRKGDLAAVCINVGRVSRAMLNVHAQELWNMEAMLKVDPSATNVISPELFQGAPAFLTGMAYHENLSRTKDILAQLHKTHDLSYYSLGLALLTAKRVSGQLPNQGDIILNQPAVDVAHDAVAIAFNGTIHGDSGDEKTAQTSFRALWTGHASSEEHQILNSFYKEADSASTAKLLRLAQMRSTPTNPGIFALNYLNYAHMGNSNINGTLLKNYDATMWQHVTNWFSGSDAVSAQVFITPGSVTNNSNTYKGVGAFLWSQGGRSAALITPNLNGAFGPPRPDVTYTAPNAINYSLQVDVFGNYYLATAPPSASSVVLAPDAFASYNAGNVANNANQNYYSYSQFQNTWTGNALDALGLPSQGSQNLNFSLGIEATSGNNGFLGWTGDGLSQFSSGLGDPVHMVTGEFYVNATDLILPGPMPLTINRNYSSLNLAGNEFGFGWKLNYMPYLSVNADTNIIYAAEPDGAVIAYEKTSTNVNVFLPTTAKNPQLNNNTTAGIGSVANRLRNRIEKQVSGPDTFYYLFPPSGGKRTFKLMAFNTGGVNRTRPYLTRWEDSRGNSFSFEYGTDSTRADYAQARRVQSSNGNYLGFVYNVYGHIIEAYTGDGRRFAYTYDQFGDLVAATLPDQAVIAYEYEHKTQNVTNGVTVTTNLFSTHLLLKEIKPDGRVLKNEYDEHRRVTNQWATVGADLNLVRNATFIYSNSFNLTNSFTNTISGFTIIKDVNNNTNRYDYTNSLITRIADGLNQTVVQDWYEAFETNKVGYYPRSLESTTDKRGLTTAFKYDANGNLTNSLTTGDLTGDGITQSASNSAAYDANNLPVLTTDQVGNKVQTLYHPQFSFLPEYVVRLAGSTPISTNKMEYVNVTDTFVAGGVTYTNASFGVLSREIRALNSPDVTTKEWTRDGRGFITQSIDFTGTEDPSETNTFFYNDRNQLVEKIDGKGRKTKFDYDAMGRPILREIYETAQTIPLSWEYSYYNENGELTWSDGPRYNPEDYVWRDYDGAGRMTTEIRWRSEVNDDATGVKASPGDNLFAQTFLEYDGFGNLKRSLNPRGAIKTNTWDALGRLVQTKFYDLDGTTILSAEGFAYEAGGQLRFHTNALGGLTEIQYTANGLPKFRKNTNHSTNAWRYYLDGRVFREFQGNGAYWETAYDDANRKSTRTFYSSAGTPLATNVTQLDRRGNLVKRTDAGGFVFTNLFDGLDRLKISAGPPVVTVTEDCMTPGCGVYVTNVVQQTMTHYYGAANAVVTNVNALGEKIITTSDAMGRAIRTEIRNVSGVLVSETSTGYAPDQHSVTVTNGSGATAIVSTSYTDNDGRLLLSIAYPFANVRELTRRTYDLAGNLEYEERDSDSNGVLTAWSGKSVGFDGMDRLRGYLDRDNAATYLYHDSAGNLTNRTLPGSLQWNAIYNSSGQILQDWNTGTGGVSTRTNTYAYFGAGSPFAGLLQSRTDGRGVTCTHTYDDWLRVVTNEYVGPNFYSVPFVDAFQYDNRGLVTNIFEQPHPGLPVIVQRAYDAYGQLVSEVSNTIIEETPYTAAASQTWDAAGRRTRLNVGAQSYAFGWRADGLLASVVIPGVSASYSYNSAGILTNRVVASRSTTINSLDGTGRPLSITTKASLSTKLTETLTWSGDGRLNSHTLAREDFTDSRAYEYAPLSRRITTERLNLDSSKRWTNSFTHDAGVSGGLGTLTKVGSEAAPYWTSAVDAFSRNNIQTNTSIRRQAFGRINGNATVTALLDGQPNPVRLEDTADSAWPKQWWSLLELTPGPHQLVVSAKHPSGLFTTNASIWITNSAANETVFENYDAAGFITSRIWKNSSGQTNRSQGLLWDHRGRLIQVIDIDTNKNGFHWVAVYDALDRRITTLEVGVTNSGYIFGESVQQIAHYYDPLVEFLELGVTLNEASTWKLYGPDLNATYGGMNGVGGLEGTLTDLDPFQPTVSDARGNVLGTVTNGVGVRWTAARPTGYGAVPGHRPVPLGRGGNVSESNVWRGRYVESTGYVWLGARFYDPEGGKFLSSDPVWNGRDPNYYSFCGGDPINFFDPDGRQGWALNGPQVYWDENYRNMIHSPEYQQGFQIGMAQGAWLGTKLTIAGVVGFYTGGAAAPYLASWGASTPFVAIGSGMVGGASGDLAVQSIEWGTLERDQLSGTQLAFSTLLGGGINYGVNRITAGRLMNGQMGNSEIGALGEQRAAQELATAGENIRGQQVQFRTPDGKPKVDFLIDDAQSPTGVRGLEIKTGDANLRYAQEWGYPHVRNGNSSPMGKAAGEAGLTVGQTLGPTPVDIWRYQPWELLPFDLGFGGAASAGATVSGSQSPPLLGKKKYY